MDLDGVEHAAMLFVMVFKGSNLLLVRVHALVAFGAFATMAYLFLRTANQNLSYNNRRTIFFKRTS